MTPDPVVVESAPKTTTLLRLLVVAFVLLAVLVAILSYAYLRVAWELAETSDQLDAARSERLTDSQVLAEVREAVDEVRAVALLFASFADPDPAVRAEVRADLQRLADEIRAEQAADDERSTRESAAPATTSTTTTTTQPPTTTTTTQPEEPPGEGGVCLGPIRIGACP